MDKAKTTNHILGERIQLLESANEQDIFEKYFPSISTATVKETPPHTQAHTTPQQHHCYLQPPCLAYSYHPTNAATASDDLKKGC